MDIGRFKISFAVGLLGLVAVPGVLMEEASDSGHCRTQDAAEGPSGSIRFLVNQPQRYDFGDQRRLPPGFGVGEFTLELWIKPDTTFPVGSTPRGSPRQLTHWTEADFEPYSSGWWWFAGNWLLDGHTRPQGFTPEDTREGTFSLQFYGGGRLRWMFADGADDVPVGKVWTVQAYPASTVHSLLDGRWHHVACVRRWVGTSGTELELWIDGSLIASTPIPHRVNMRRFWDELPHPDNPRHLGGWSWGSEVMTGWNYFFTQYEDYKGLVDELRFWDRARTVGELSGTWDEEITGNEAGLVGLFPFDEGKGRVARDRLDPTRTIVLHRSRPETWSREDAPVKRPSHDK